MRTAEEIRDGLLEEARMAVSKAPMFATNGRALETLVSTLMGFVAYAEGRENTGLGDRLRRYGKEGITGPFHALFGRDERLVNEVGAVMAQQLHRLGYLEVDRLLDPVRFHQIRAEIRDRFDEVDLFASEITADLGEPSFQIKDDVWAYGSRDIEAGWIFLSFRPDPEPTYKTGSASGPTSATPIDWCGSCGPLRGRSRRRWRCPHAPSSRSGAPAGTGTIVGGRRTAPLVASAKACRPSMTLILHSGCGAPVSPSSSPGRQPTTRCSGMPAVEQ